MKKWIAVITAAALVGCTSIEAPAPKKTDILPPPDADPIELSKPAPQPMRSAPLNPNSILSRIAFGSCLQQEEDQSIWNTIAATSPDAFLFIGDNVYGDNYSGEPGLPELEDAYARLALSQPFANLRASTPVLPIWDDHDYGYNDKGAEFEKRELAEKLFDYVWAVPDDAPSRQRPGVYYARMVGVDGKRVQIIMLDTRFFRSELKPTDEEYAPGKERYVPDYDENKTMLGEAQWQWLEKQLKKEADLRLIVSSVQIIADGHGWEAWRTLPRERQRLYGTLNVMNIDNAVFLSGDRHSGAIYKRENVAPVPLYEITSSSLNLPASKWRAERGETRMEDGPFRITDMFYDENFGLLDIDWDRNEVALKLMDKNGDVVQQQVVGF